MSSAVLVWLVLGAALIATELATGTFYLLVFGAAAWAGAATAYFNPEIRIQIFAAGAAALGGLAILVPYDIRRRAHARSTNTDLDVGNDVQVEKALGSGKLKVRYRGTTWDATTEGAASSAANVDDWYTIVEVRGNTLVVKPKS